MLFRCIHTGQLYSFEAEFDIKAMLKHPEYQPVEEESKEETKQDDKPKRKAKGE